MLPTPTLANDWAMKGLVIATLIFSLGRKYSGFHYPRLTTAQKYWKIPKINGSVLNSAPL